MRVRTSTALAAVAGLLLTAGCGALSRGHDAADEFTEHFTSTYPDYVVEATPSAADELPFSGKVSGTLVLADDTPPEMLDQLLGEVETWTPETSVGYTGMGVVANGLGICLDDPQRAAKLDLRTALYAEGLALQGSWGCPPWPTSTEQTYRGTLAHLLADTESVREVFGEGPGLVLHAEVSDPWGRVTGPWTELPTTLPDTLEAVAAIHGISAFRLEGDTLTVNAAGSRDLTEARAAAERAAGQHLTVQVLQGSLDPEEATANEALLTVVEDLREEPGVAGVHAVRGIVEVSSEDPAALRAIHDAALGHPDMPADTGLRIRIVEPGETSPVAGSAYSRSAGSTGDDHLDAFAALVALPTVREAGMGEPPAGAPAVLDVTLATGFTEGIASLRAVLPDGMEVTAHAPEGFDRVELTTARTLTEDDVSTAFTAPDIGAIVEAWNTAP